MRKLPLVALVAAAPILFAPSGASAWCDCDGPSYGYASYGYSAPIVYGYSSYYAPGFGYSSYFQPRFGYSSYYGSGSYYRPRAFGYRSYYRSGVRFYGARTVGWRAGVGVRRVGWRGGRRW
jgi:hypothetical protein